MLKLSLTFGLFLLFFGLLGVGKAHAETNTPIDSTAPTPNSGTTSGGANFTPITGVGRGAFSGVSMWYKIYVRNGQSTTITVNQTCTDSFGNPTVDYSMENLSDIEQDYGPGNQGNIWVSAVQSSSNCNQSITFDVKSTYGIASAIQGHTDYHVFGFYAQMEPGPGSAEQYFNVTSSNNANGNSYVGLAKPDLTNKKVLSWSTIYKTSGTWGASIMFAPQCNQNINNPVQIQIFDADNGIYQNNMHAYLEHAPELPYINSGTLNWSTQTSWTAQQVQGGPWGTSGTVGTLMFNASNDEVYKFHVVGSSHPNTIQIKLPFDQFDAKRTVRTNCFKKVSCTITSTSPSPAVIAPGGSISITVTGSASPGAWPNSYYIRRSPTPYGASYKDITSPGVSSGVDTASPPVTVTFNYFVASSNPNDTTNGLAGGPAINGTNCQQAVTVGTFPQITCVVGAKANMPPGQTDPQMYTVNVTAKGSGTGGNYSVNMTANPGAYVTGANPQTVAIPNNPGNITKPVFFSGYLNYQGDFTVNITDPRGASAATCSGSGVPVVAPYFQVWQNDAAAGGGFSNQNNQCPGLTGGFVSPQAVGGANGKYAGGIRAMSSPSIQAKSDFGAEALGQIPVSATEGFYAGLGTASLRTWFANTASPPGYLNPAGPGNCVLDYYDTTSSVNPSSLPLLGDLHNDINPTNCPLDPNTNSYRCAFQAPDGTVINGAAITTPDNYQISIYVDGNITIDTNITYGNFNPNVRADIPYFTVIAKGNISLSDLVTTLDGLYVAQPRDNGSGAIVPDTGIFATCDQNISGGQCTHQLEVDGAVVAQHVELLREHGSSQPLSNDVYSIGTNPAEIFNFVPSMVLGAPGLNAQPSLPQGLFSLPPVF